MEPLQGTATGKDSIARVRYSHDAMIDLILQEPGISQGKLAQYFGYTEGWVSRVVGSDAFQARLAARKDEVVTPAVMASMNEKLQGLAHQSMEIIKNKLEATSSPDLAMKTLELTTKALGMGARVGQQNNIQNNTYVVALPQKATDENTWATEAKVEAKRVGTARAQDHVVDVQVKETVK